MRTQHKVLRDISLTIALEQSQGHWEIGNRAGLPVRLRISDGRLHQRLFFDTLVRSSVTCHETRIKVWLGWGAVLHGPQYVTVWALLFQCLLWELLQLHCSHPAIKGVFIGTRSKHRFFGRAALTNCNGRVLGSHIHACSASGSSSEKGPARTIVTCSTGCSVRHVGGVQAPSTGS